jgi:hypothetical protein
MGHSDLVICFIYKEAYDETRYDADDLRKDPMFKMAMGRTDNSVLSCTDRWDGVFEKPGSSGGPPDSLVEDLQRLRSSCEFIDIITLFLRFAFAMLQRNAMMTTS